MILLGGDFAGLLSTILVYSLVLIFSGMEIERSYINHLMPEVLTAEFMRGAKLSVEIGKAEEQRNELQGVRHKPLKITVRYGKH